MKYTYPDGRTTMTQHEEAATCSGGWPIGHSCGKEATHMLWVGCAPGTTMFLCEYHRDWMIQYLGYGSEGVRRIYRVVGQELKLPQEKTKVHTCICYCGRTSIHDHFLRQPKCRICGNLMWYGDI